MSDRERLKASLHSMSGDYLIRHHEIHQGSKGEHDEWSLKASKLCADAANAMESGDAVMEKTAITAVQNDPLLARELAERLANPDPLV